MGDIYAITEGVGNVHNIFLPGTGWSAEFGTPIADALKEHFVTHMLDLPGIGRSKGLEGIVKLQDAANWLHSYVKQNHLQKVNVIGHSLGGIIGLSYAFYYPDKVNKLILLDIGYAKIERFPVKMMGNIGYVLPIISILHRIFGQKILGDGPQSTNHNEEANKTEDSIQQTIIRLGLKDTPFIRKSIQNQPSPSNEGISLLLAAYRANLPKLVKKIKVPCLVLFGDRENEPEKFRKKQSKKVDKLKKNGIKTEVLNGGHYAHVSDNKAIKYTSSFLLNRSV
ncbi:alpha/beta hydrolase [Peribacillus butanolivorans]|uniref:alpha/beta hydrolase n=1 Tax=Peribacillus butanolivorans TaxID=421767 RepID=UPI00207C79DF|nr:alpha/beta hydrolase [Peribacillus butanolivorans]MCO0601161.1 alpha/beta hydrolase [Peribacillus butanolivorans]